MVWMRGGMWNSKKPFGIALEDSFEQRSQILCRLCLFKQATETLSWSELFCGLWPSFSALSLFGGKKKKNHTWSRKLKTKSPEECAQRCYRTKPGHPSRDPSKTSDLSNSTFLGKPDTSFDLKSQPDMQSLNINRLFMSLNYLLKL